MNEYDLVLSVLKDYDTQEEIFLRAWQPCREGDQYLTDCNFDDGLIYIDKKIWIIFKDQFHMDSTEAREFMQHMLSKHFDIQGLYPIFSEGNLLINNPF